MKERIDWIDVCRGLAILAIFIGHLSPVDDVTIFVFRYHVPLFFFLSGFFFGNKKSLSIGRYTLHSFKTVLIPYAIFCLLNIVFFIITNGNDIGVAKDFFLQSIFGIRNQIGFGGQLWFFTCLFAIQIMYYLLVKVLRKTAILLIMTTCSAVISALLLNAPNNPSWFFNVDSAFYYIFFYCLGDAISLKLRSMSISRLNFPFKILTVIGSILILAISFYIYCRPSIIDAKISEVSNLIGIGGINGVVLQILILILAIFLISANIIISFFLRESKYLATLGRNTLILCGNETISLVLATTILAFFSLTANTDIVLFKVIVMLIKVEIIRLLLLPLFNKHMPWIYGRYSFKEK